MSVKYHIVERYNPTKPEEPKKFYPSIKAGGRVTTRELVETASEMCSLTASDLMGAIEIILSIIPKELSKGNSVELGDFGSFWLRTKTEGAETAEDVTPDQISNVLPRFIPGTQFKWQLKKIRFNRN
jgi:predicted histone-like DNA-binding protein